MTTQFDSFDGSGIDAFKETALDARNPQGLTTSAGVTPIVYIMDSRIGAFYNETQLYTGTTCLQSADYFAGGVPPAYPRWTEPIVPGSHNSRNDLGFSWDWRDEDFAALIAAVQANDDFLWSATPYHKPTPLIAVVHLRGVTERFEPNPGEPSCPTHFLNLMDELGGCGLPFPGELPVAFRYIPIDMVPQEFSDHFGNTLQVYLRPSDWAQQVLTGVFSETEGLQKRLRDPDDTSTAAFLVRYLWRIESPFASLAYALWVNSYGTVDAFGHIQDAFDGMQIGATASDELRAQFLAQFPGATMIETGRFPGSDFEAAQLRWMGDAARSISPAI